jgi:ATP-binding cassette subfamily B protein
MVRMFLSIGLIIVVDVAAIELVTIPLLMYINFELTLWLILPLPFLTLLTTRLIKRLHKASRAVQDHNAELSSQVQEMYSGARVIKAYNRENETRGLFTNLSSENVKINMNLAWIRGWFHLVVFGAALIIQFVFLWVGGSMTITGDLVLKDFVKFNLYMMWVVFPMAYLGWGINLFQRGLASMERLREVTNTDPAIKDTSTTDHSIESLDGAIEFRNLSFNYDGRPVLKGINMKIEPGTTVAIVGRTGSGKSTLVHLLSRLYDPPADSIYIGGHEVHTIPLQVLRRHIGFVTQEPLLFSETIRENIAFGAPDLTDEQVRKAAELAGVHAEIEGFPLKYDTMLGERGVNISGGQKQRTTIARALAVDPTVLVLDDALASVDTNTEEAILDHLRDVRRGRTCLIISHRVSSVKDADMIVVLEHGVIAEMGDHDSLIAHRGYYYDLYRKQELAAQLEKA